MSGDGRSVTVFPVLDVTIDIETAAFDAVSDRGGRHVAQFLRSIIEDRYFRVRRAPDFEQIMGHIYWLKLALEPTFIRRLSHCICIIILSNLACYPPIHLISLLPN